MCPAWLLLLAPWLSAGLDQALGDPRRWPHPVQAMGWLILALQRPLEAWAGDRPGPLRLAGVLITATTVGLSAAAGLTLEQLAVWGVAQGPGLGAAASVPLLLALASSLAGRSLRQAVDDVLRLLPPTPAGAAPGSGASPAAAMAPGASVLQTPSGADLDPARRQLAWIVGRDTEQLDEPGILRALAETASENAVDGLFAPLFWMLVGCTLMLVAGPLSPGPLSLAWGFKAASTLDSMLGYRRGRLRWLGTAGARLDDALTWLPCRLVALSLPLAAGHPGRSGSGFRQALEQGRPDPSPNAGVSQAAYALAAGVRLGGVNSYRGELRCKPILAPDQPPADRAAVNRIQALSERLLLLWLLLWSLAMALGLMLM